MKTITKKYLIIGILISIVIILIVSVFIYNRTKENNAWELATKTNSSTSYEDYLKSYPNGKYKIKADSLYDQSLWTETIKASYFEAYQSYLNKIPNGFHIAEAKTILKKSEELPLLSENSIRKKELLIFTNHNRFLVVATAKKMVDGNLRIQLKVFKCNMAKINSNDNIWQIVWNSKIENAPFYSDLYVLKAKDEALIISEHNLGGAHCPNGYIGIRIDSNGKVNIEKDIEDINFLEFKNNSINATGSNKRIEFKVGEYNIVEKIINRSEMADENAVKAFFHFNQNGQIEAKNYYVDLKVGQTIAFIPENKTTKDAFNKGEIAIYSDIDNSPLLRANCSMIPNGNSCKMETSGEFHFLLYNEFNANRTIGGTPDYQPTFTVRVSNPITQSENRVQSVQNTQSTSNSRTVTNTQSSTSGGYRRSNRDYFAGESAVHEFLSRHSFISNDGSRLSYSIGDLTITYNHGRLRFTNIEVRIYNQDVAVVSATDIGSGRTLRIKLNATYGSIVDMNDNSMSFQAVN